MDIMDVILNVNSISISGILVLWYATSKVTVYIPVTVFALTIISAVLVVLSHPGLFSPRSISYLNCQQYLASCSSDGVTMASGN